MALPSRKIISHLTKLDNQVKARDLSGAHGTLVDVKSYMMLANGDEAAVALAVRSGVFFRVASALDSRNWPGVDFELDRNFFARIEMEESGQAIYGALRHYFEIYDDVRTRLIAEFPKINSCVDACMDHALFNGPGNGVPQFEYLRQTIERHCRAELEISGRREDKRGGVGE